MLLSACNNMDNQDDMSDIEVYFFKKAPFLFKSNQPTDAEIKAELDTISENKEVVYENGEAVGIAILYKVEDEDANKE